MKVMKMLKRVMLAVLTCSLLLGTAAVPVMADLAVEFEGQAELEAQADAIISKNVKAADSQKKKLKKLYKYAFKTYKYKRSEIPELAGWYKSYALEMFQAKKGSCYHDAAAFAYLAKKATGYDVRVAIGKTNGFTGKLQQHAWTEIRIGSTWYICDPNLNRTTANKKKPLKYFLQKRTSLKKTYKLKNADYETVVL